MITRRVNNMVPHHVEKAWSTLGEDYQQREYANIFTTGAEIMIENTTSAAYWCGAL